MFKLVGNAVAKIQTHCPELKYASRTIPSHSFSDERVTNKQKKLMERSLPKQKAIPGVDKILLVSSGKGGVGKSTVAVNMALGIKELTKKSVGLLDADVFGPSIPKLMGLHGKPDITKENMMIPHENYGIKCMSMGFLIKEGAPVVWRGLMVMQAVQQLLWKVDWGELDLLVVDLPPGTGDVQLSIVQNVPVSGSVIVTTPQDIALIDVRRGVEMFKKLNVPVFGVVQNMSHFCCPKCGHETSIFGQDSKIKKFATATITEILGKFLKMMFYSRLTIMFIQGESPYTKIYASYQTAEYQLWLQRTVPASNRVLHFLKFHKNLLKNSIFHDKAVLYKS
uniref:iron-sulfur protein NUBPL isoform X1 n=1 Tax=Ciona intestinalis TaxID=7719 RepID=UPI00089DC4E9|nr:iron-sulfur protein NUBPL isoform X1 [Ciona intestinalis]|eukprot:XP_009862092.2 iron-sulfur protein NUBPL isoform X1 [Ciona intestinalis]